MVNPTPAPTPAPSPTPTPNATDKNKDKDKNKDTKTIAPIRPEDIPKPQHPPSPLMKQHRDRRGQPDYDPVSIIFLTGEYKGEVLDLGVAIEEISHSQSAEWSTHSNQSIRVGANFSRISPREISMSLTFFDIKYDIAHLAEGLAHLQEIQPTLKTPPEVMIKQGDVTALRCVCTSLRWKYDTPHSLKAGFRKAGVELTFLLLGGKSSPDASGMPLTGTAIQAKRQSKTDVEASLEGNLEIAKLLMAACLGEKGSDQLQGLIKNRQLSQVEEILKLDNDAIVQGAVAGIFNKSVYEDDKVRDKIGTALAISIANKEQGLTREEQFQLANALLKEDRTMVPARLSGLWDKMTTDYKTIKQSVLKQDFDSDPKSGDSKSKIFADPETAERFRQIGHCGLALRQVGGTSFSNPFDSKVDQEVLDKINTTLTTKSDEELMKQFGLASKVQLSRLKNGGPYTSKEDFWNRSTGSVVGATGMVLWQNFENANPQPTPAPTPQK